MIKNSTTTSRGFTLVELLVSATIVAVGVTGVVTMLRKTQDLSVSDAHRRQARSIITSTFEKPTFLFQNYANLVTGTPTPTTVVIDPRGAGSTADDLNGTLSDSIGPEQTLTGANSIPIVYRLVIMKARWKETSVYDSVVITKMLTQAQ